MTELLSPGQLGRMGWHNRQGVYVTRTQLNYMRQTADDRILFGRRLGVFMNAPRDPPLDRTTAPYRRLVGAFHKTFPQLDDIRFTHAWNGPIALTTRMASAFPALFRGQGRLCRRLFRLWHHRQPPRCRYGACALGRLRSPRNRDGLRRHLAQPHAAGAVPSGRRRRYHACARHRRPEGRLAEGLAEAGGQDGLSPCPRWIAPGNG